jgi:hypothetical protein
MHKKDTSSTRPDARKSIPSPRTNGDGKNKRKQHRTPCGAQNHESQQCNEIHLIFVERYA